MSDEQNETLVSTNYDMSPYLAYVPYPYFRNEHEYHGDQRFFPFLLPFLGGLAGGLLAGAVYQPGPAYYPVYQPFPVYQPYPFPPYGPYYSGYNW